MTTIVQAAYIVAALLFIMALAGLSKHETAKTGNAYGVTGMVIAIVATVGLALKAAALKGALGIPVTLVLIIVAMAIGLGVLGAAWGWTSRLWHSQHSALAFAAVGWAVVVGILLPISGSGFLGLADSITTPLIWAALFAIYGVVLELGGDPAAPGAATDIGRRRLLGVLPVTIGAVSLGVLAFRLLPGWYDAIANAPGSGVAGISPEITPVDEFYVVSKNFVDPSVSADGWHLAVGWMVDKPLTLSLSDLQGLAKTTEYVTLECISNNVGGPQMSTGDFVGVSLRDLLAMAGPQAGGTWVAFKARDGYEESLKGPKWLDSISVVNQESNGYWEQQGWDHNAVVKTTSRFDVPSEGDIVKLGPVLLGGVAFAGTRGISKVEYSTDAGRTWVEAPFNPPLSALTWVIWQTTWTPAAEGAYELRVRATDKEGAVQSTATASSYPSGSSGYHSVRIAVAKA